MDNTFYIAHNGQQFGPYDMPTLQQMAASGQVTGSDVVWTEGWPQWYPATSVPGLFAPAGPPAYQPSNPNPDPYGNQSYGYQDSGGYAGTVGYQSPRTRVGPSQNGLAVAGLICSILMPLIGLILCWIALSGMKTNNNREGYGMAKAGLIISIVQFALAFLIVVIMCGIAGSMGR